ncbi:MAG: aminotransferase class V-fold PLP-dependent enzyme, partial [Polyangiales bacterium]
MAPNEDAKHSETQARPIYMDHHATTPVDSRVLAQMLPFFSEDFGNASSRFYPQAKVAENAVETAREKVASLLNAKISEIVFTSGATEANNLALQGVANALGPSFTIVTQPTEHAAVLDTVNALKRRGVTVRFASVDNAGRVLEASLREQLSEARGPSLVSIMLSNNEIGTVQDVATLSAIAKENGALFHCDASQGTGYLPLDVTKAPVDLVSLSSHKIYG